MFLSLLIVGLVGGASAKLTNTTRQTLLADRLTNQSLLGSGEECSDLGRHCNQNHNNCTNDQTGSESCGSFFMLDWLCGAEATCCVQDGSALYKNYGDANFCDGAGPQYDHRNVGTNDNCCSGQCCYVLPGTHISRGGFYRCGTVC